MVETNPQAISVALLKTIVTQTLGYFSSLSTLNPTIVNVDDATAAIGAFTFNTDNTYGAIVGDLLSNGTDYSESDLHIEEISALSYKLAQIFKIGFSRIEDDVIGTALSLSEKIANYISTNSAQDPSTDMVELDVFDWGVLSDGLQLNRILNNVSDSIENFATTPETVKTYQISACIGNARTSAPGRLSPEDLSEAAGVLGGASLLEPTNLDNLISLTASINQSGTDAYRATQLVSQNYVDVCGILNDTSLSLSEAVIDYLSLYRRSLEFLLASIYLTTLTTYKRTLILGQISENTSGKITVILNRLMFDVYLSSNLTEDDLNKYVTHLIVVSQSVVPDKGLTVDTLIDQADYVNTLMNERTIEMERRLDDQGRQIVKVYVEKVLTEFTRDFQSSTQGHSEDVDIGAQTSARISDVVSQILSSDDVSVDEILADFVLHTLNEEFLTKLYTTCMAAQTEVLEAYHGSGDTLENIGLYGKALAIIALTISLVTKNSIQTAA